MQVDNLSVYLSFPPEACTHGVAVGKVLDSLQCRHVDGVSQTATGSATQHVLVRIRTVASVDSANVIADTRAFTSYYMAQNERRVIDLIMEPGYVVWPEPISCPVTYINTIGRPYTEWVRELETALAGGQQHGGIDDYEGDADEYLNGDEDYDFDDYFDEDPY